MTVISRNSMNEEKFRTAVSNWIKSEKLLFKKQERSTVRMLIGTLIFGTIMILLCLSIEKQIDVLQYSLMPIMGSLALSKSAGILVLDIPILMAKKWIINEMEGKNLITFQYDNRQ